MKAIVFIFIAFIIPLVISQTQLLPGETIIEVTPIVLTPVPDYTKKPQLIGLIGSNAYLMISWNATYLGGLERDIAVICYLNCQNLTEADITTSCAGIQNCTYRGLPGYKSCSILSPSYFYNKTNTIACKFFDPVNPNLLYLYYGKPYMPRNFSTINFTLEVSPVKITVGKPFTLPIKITNFGLFVSNFSTNTTALQPNVLIDKSYGVTDVISYGETAATFPTILMLVEQNVNLQILANSTEDRFYCLTDVDCLHFKENGIEGVCIKNTCHKKLILTIEAGKASLPEFNFFNLLLILPLILAIFLYLKRKLKNGSVV